MKKTFSSKKSAFSLIELSIVLIIIGLLIAGVTGGASLIKSSELRSVMGEARGYAVVVNAFYTQYNALPGDYGTVLGTADYFGDNDGTIEYAKGVTNIYDSEANVAWSQLASVGAAPAVPTLKLIKGAVPGTLIPLTNFPASKVKSAGWQFDYISTQNVVVLTGTIAEAAVAGNTLNTLASGVITPADALSIDAKIDDGIANTGKVKGGLTGATTTSACISTAAYAVTNATKTCSLTYQVDVNS